MSRTKAQKTKMKVIKQLFFFLAADSVMRQAVSLTLTPSMCMVLIWKRPRMILHPKASWSE